MPDVPLTELSYLVAAWAAAIHFVVGIALWRRPVEADVRGPMRGLALWWFGLGVLGVAVLLPKVGLGPAELGMGAVRGVVYLIFGFIYAMLTGLLHYLFFVYTGRRRLVLGLIPLYVIHFVMLVWMFESQGPGVVLVDGRHELVFADPLPEGAWQPTVFYLFLTIPPLIGVFAYSALWFKVHDPTVRYRVALVSSGLMIWLIYTIFFSAERGFLGLLHSTGWWRLGGEIVGLVAALAVYVAYFPPRIIRDRFHVEGAPGSPTTAARHGGTEVDGPARPGP